MAKSVSQIKASLLRDYYKYFSKYAKGKAPERKVAWVTAFTPVEILEALDIACYYPESYAAVIAASGKEQDLLEESSGRSLCGDCCSYSCCIEGCLGLGKAPRGIPPKPDILIATNNQCNTLPCWWNLLADRYHVPLIVLDYPGETAGREVAYSYVTEQHRDLIAELEKLSGNWLDLSELESLIRNSRESVAAWEKVAESAFHHGITPTMLFDDISFLITSRCRQETVKLYTAMEEEISQMPYPSVDEKKIRVFWLGYPLWYHPQRYLKEFLEDFRIVGANYITWWNLDYSGESVFEQLFQAYNYTFLNLTQETKNKKLAGIIRRSGASCAITLHNKSCKCDFVSARNVRIPQAELETDMIDRTFLDLSMAQEQIRLLKEAVCTG